MSLEPCACAGLPFPPRPLRVRPRAAAALIAAIAVCLAGCQWEDENPPATAANAASASSGGVAAGAPQQDPSEPLPPGGPIAPPPGQSAAPADGDDGAKYASGEYAIGAETDSYDDNDPAALNDFHKPLDPYGAWVDDPTYGTVWVPSPGVVGPDFQPYVSAGHWAYDDDYVWVSDYPWGWAPFHYGRWVLVEGRGWSWIPGREYRGAWVTWSVDDGYSYLGWAPMGPSFVWFGGVAVGWHGYWGPRWSYCPRGDVFAPRVGAHVIVGPGAVAIAGRMRPYAVADVRVGGPPPSRLGYSAAQIPRATAVPSVAHAEQFARPSTARALGASAPAHFESASAGTGARAPLTSGARQTPGVSGASRSNVGAANVDRFQTAPAPGRAPAVTPGAGTSHPAPAAGAYRSAPAAARPSTNGAWHGGGGSHGGGHHH